MDILHAARELRPGTNWTCRDGVLEQALDGNARVTVPTANELKAVMDADSYKDKRRDAYPPLVNLADALVHQANGDSAPLAQYIAACNTVKTQFPKP